MKKPEVLKNLKAPKVPTLPKAGGRLSRACALILALLLALPLALTPSGAAAASGGYIEQEITLPEGYASSTAPTSLPGSGFAVAAKRADTGAWELLTYVSVAETPAVTPLDSSMGEISSISMAADGQLMAVLSDLPALAGPSKSGEGTGGGSGGEAGQGKQRLVSLDSMETTVAWYDQSGAVSASFKVPGMVYSSVALSGRRLATLVMRSGATVYDDKGNTLTTIGRNDIYSLAAGADDTLFLAQEDKVAQVDLKGQTVRSYPSAQNLSGSLTAAIDGTLYLIGVTGIYRLDPDAAEPTLVSDAARYLIGAPDSSVSGVCALADGTMVVQLGGGFTSMVTNGGRNVSTRIGGPDENAKLVAYVFDASLDLSSDTKFTITALRDSSTLRKAVSDFQRAHPELTVNLNVSLASDDSDSPVEDAIRTLNTDLLAGKGGDILILDEMPLSQYISKGVLAPLDDALSGIGFLSGILESSRAADGKLYAVPAQFSFGTVWGDRGKLTGIDSLDALVGMPLDNGQELMYARTPENLFELLYPASRAAFLDESGKPRFDTPEFEAFLEVLYQIYSSQISQPESSGQSLRAAAAQSARIGNAEELQSMLNGAQAVLPATISSTMTAALPYTIAGAAKSAFIPVPGLGSAGRSYTPSLMAGINARTANRALCEEFLRLLYSPGIQELDSMEGLPTVTASLDKLVADAKERNKDRNIMMALSFGGNPINMEQPNDDIWDALRAVCDTLDHPYASDPTLLSFMVEETAAFFEGRDTARSAALAVQQRATAYLNE